MRRIPLRSEAIRGQSLSKFLDFEYHKGYESLHLQTNDQFNFMLALHITLWRAIGFRQSPRWPEFFYEPVSSDISKETRH